MGTKTAVAEKEDVMPQRAIIGLCGFAQSGKDTVGRFLVEDHGYARDAFADDLKRALLEINPFVPIDGELERLRDLVERVGWDDAKQNAEVRRLLGTTGTEGGWKIHGKRLWIDRVDERLRALPAGQPLVVTDVRFPEEQDWLTENGGLLVNVVRPAIEALPGELGKHSSEATWMLRPDVTLLNKGTIADLGIDVARLLDSL